MADPTVGVYFHIPFCERICPYCDFAVVAANTLECEVEDRYVDALANELAARREDFKDRRLALLQIRPFVQSGRAQGSAFLTELDSGTRERGKALVSLDGIPKTSRQGSKK